MCFNQFGQSPLVKHFLQKRRLSKVTGYSILTKRTELNQVIPSGAPTYDDVIRESLRESKERTARLVSQRRCVEKCSGSHMHTHTHSHMHMHTHTNARTNAHTDRARSNFAVSCRRDQRREICTNSKSSSCIYIHTPPTSDTLNVFAGNCGSCCRHRKKWRALAMNWLNTGK